MWVEELRLENIKSFESTTLRLGRQRDAYPWVTLLGENGGGKSTALQALGLLLAGPESIPSLARRPLAWLRDEQRSGIISVRIHQDDGDPGQFGEERVTRVFGYSYHVTGSQPIEVRNRLYSEPSVVENPDKRLSWLRQNAFRAGQDGWFAAGYGPFRRLTRSSQVIVPSLSAPSRSTNFVTQFNEEEPMSALERWLVYLDYRVAKSKDPRSKAQMEMGVAAIDELLPAEAKFDRVTDEGRILFSIDGTVVPTIALSDGYRSVLAFGGDLIWRLVQAFPDSDNPLHEPGVVLIDELDIHLHPVWQRQIASWLRSQFPKIQFIVATHSPLIAAGAGMDALTLKFDVDGDGTRVTPIEGVAALSVDQVLQSPAFGLVSAYSPDTESKIRRYDDLLVRGRRRSDEENGEFEQLALFMETARPIGGPPDPQSLDGRIERFISETLP